jgi:RNA polymerase sigma-70 factor (ECF subfamily)
MLVNGGNGTIRAMLFRRGNPQRERFERMAEDSFASVYGTALRLTRDADDANDLAQEAVIRAYEAFDRFDGRNFRAWIVRITVNLFINKYRKRVREGTPASLDDEDHPVVPIAPGEEAPDRMLLDGMLGEEVEAALARVPEVFRTAVVLSDLEGMSYEEIAEATESPIGTVRSRIARGRAMLRRELMDYATEQGHIKQQ